MFANLLFKNKFTITLKKLVFSQRRYVVMGGYFVDIKQYCILDSTKNPKEYAKYQNNLVIFADLVGYHQSENLDVPQKVFFVLEFSDELVEFLSTSDQFSKYELPKFFSYSSVFPAVVDLSDQSQQYLIFDAPMDNNENGNNVSQLNKIYSMSYFFESIYGSKLKQFNKKGFLRLISSLIFRNNKHFITFGHCPDKHFPITKKTYLFLYKHFLEYNSYEVFFMDQLVLFTNEVLKFFNSEKCVLIVVETNKNKKQLHDYINIFLLKNTNLKLEVVLWEYCEDEQRDTTQIRHYYELDNLLNCDIMQGDDSFDFVNYITKNRQCALLSDDLFLEEHAACFILALDPILVRIISEEKTQSPVVSNSWIRSIFSFYVYEITFYRKVIDLTDSKEKLHYNHTLYSPSCCTQGCGDTHTPYIADGFQVNPGEYICYFNYGFNKNKFFSKDFDNNVCFEVVQEVPEADLAIGVNRQNLLEFCTLKDYLLDLPFDFIPFIDKPNLSKLKAITDKPYEWLLVKLKDSFKTEVLTSKAIIMNLLFYYKNKYCWLNLEYYLAQQTYLKNKIIGKVINKSFLKLVLFNVLAFIDAEIHFILTLKVPDDYFYKNSRYSDDVVFKTMKEYGFVTPGSAVKFLDVVNKAVETKVIDPKKVLEYTKSRKNTSDEINRREK